MILAWLLKNWRLIAYALAVAVILWVGLLVRHWHTDSAVRLPEAQAALAAEQACAAGSKCAERQAALVARQQAISEQVVRGYEQELADIRNRPVAPVVRLCKPARRSPVHLPGTAPAADGASADRDVQVEVGADIGRQLFELADSADAEALKLRYLQDYSRAISAVK